MSLRRIGAADGDATRRHHGVAGRRGSVMIWSVLSMSVTAGIAALAFDVGRARAAKGELQAAADAAALNAATGLADNTYVVRAQAAAAENRCDGTSVALTAADVTVGNWANRAFVANGTPRNAVRVTAERTRTRGNPIQSGIASMLGLPPLDVRASAIVCGGKAKTYEWASVTSTTLSSGGGFRVTAYDATDATAPETLTTLRANGSISLSGNAVVNADVKYGTTKTVSGTTTVAGTSQQVATPDAYDSGATVAGQAGVTDLSTATDLSVVGTTRTLPGGTYVVRNLNLSSGTLTFTGPATVIVTGDVTTSSSAINTYNNLPANLRVISTGTNASIQLSNPTRPIYADFHAPGAAMTLSAGNSNVGLRGRGVFRSIGVSSSGTLNSLSYDRSLAVGKSMVVR